MNPPQAERASAPPTLTRRTPSAEMSCIVRSLAEPTNRLNGFGATAATTAAICSRAADTRRVQAVGARLRVGLEPCNRFVEIGPTHEETLGAPNQQRVAARFVDCCPRRPHSLDCNAEFE